VIVLSPTVQWFGVVGGVAGKASTDLTLFGQA